MTAMELYFDFNHRKDFPDGRFAYVAPLLFGRARINVTRLGDEWSVDSFW